MEEKKRTRPTWAMVRKLEAEVARLKDDGGIDEQLEGTSLIVRDCDAWRDKYRKKVCEVEALMRRVEMLTDENKRLRGRGLWSRLMNK